MQNQIELEEQMDFNNLFAILFTQRLSGKPKQKI
jgi:hypothetical protein